MSEQPNDSTVEPVKSYNIEATDNSTVATVEVEMDDEQAEWLAEAINERLITLVVDENDLSAKTGWLETVLAQLGDVRVELELAA